MEKCMYVGRAASSVSSTGSIQAMYLRKLILTLTPTRGNYEGSCSDYDQDSWAPCSFFHASRNVVQSLKHLETVQAIEHSAEVNPRKKSGNSYYRSQVTIVFISKSTKSPYILYDTPSKFYPTSHMWCLYASQPLIRVHKIPMFQVIGVYEWTEDLYKVIKTNMCKSEGCHSAHQLPSQKANRQLCKGIYLHSGSCHSAHQLVASSLSFYLHM